MRVVLGAARAARLSQQFESLLGRVAERGQERAANRPRSPEPAAAVNDHDLIAPLPIRDEIDEGPDPLEIGRHAAVRDRQAFDHDAATARALGEIRDPERDQLAIFEQADERRRPQGGQPIEIGVQAPLPRRAELARPAFAGSDREPHPLVDDPADPERIGGARSRCRHRLNVA